jgi:hypothetical protein
MKSSDGGYIINYVGGTKGPPRGWRSAGITVDGTIQTGSVFWFGFHFWRIEPRYDYGGRLYRCSASPYQDTYAGLRRKFYNYPIENEMASYIDSLGNEVEYEIWVQPSYELKISMYLEAPGENHTRTLTQGVKLTDSRKLTGNYKRSVTQTVRGNTVLNRFEGFSRKCVTEVKNTALLKREPVFIRAVVERIKAAMSTGNSREIKRGMENRVTADSSTAFREGFLRNIVNAINTDDGVKASVFVSRFIPERLNAAEVTGHWGDYLRGLYIEAGSMAETTHKAEYHRKQEDTARGEAVPLRHLFIFIRLLTVAYIRDFIIGRFLKSREEIVIKSPVCREITLDSKLR